MKRLFIEIYTFLPGLSPTVIDDDLKFNSPATHKLRILTELCSRNPKTVKYGAEAISFLFHNIWAILPQNIRNCTSLPPY